MARGARAAKFQLKGCMLRWIGNARNGRASHRCFRGWGPGRATLILVAALLNGCSAKGNQNQEFADFVDRYLDEFAKRHPSIAAGNGLHMHDDMLEDFSATGIAQESKWLLGAKVRLAQIDTSKLTPDARVDHTILNGIIDGWQLDLDVVKNWQRNPMIYAAAVSDGVHNLMTMESDTPERRLARVESKLRGVPALLAAAVTNIENPPEIFARRGTQMFQGAAAMLRGDLRLAFASVADTALARRVFALADSTATAIDTYVVDMEQRVIPGAKGKVAIGAQNVLARYRAEELLDIPLDAMLAIGNRQLAVEESSFVAAARKVDPNRDPMDVWMDIRRDHPKPGELVKATQAIVDSLQDFVTQAELVRLPNAERVVVLPSQPFDIGLASMHASPPLEPTPVKSIYYVTDANPSWPPERQAAWLERFNYASLAITSAHEAMPGHFVHALFMRQTPGKVRRIWIGLNPFPQPSSGQDGWAHYAEQMVVEQGFKAGDPRYEMAQLSESMTRICRLIAGINVHTGSWTMDQAAQFFMDKAHLPEPAARQEAERTSYDPTNGGYFLGKRAVLKLRADYKARMGDGFSLKEFHERVMKNGIAPWWAHRALMLPGDAGAIVQ
ncbi:MAG: hypothetical protein MNPFHGCM_02730 [Gemmatimonadaceae bacterium]|nr:hypothetical protein [Gemmatimonadaceae bacterium]